MKIVYLAAGAAGMYCGSCLHDNTLAAALIEHGQDVLLTPTYTPLRTDEVDVSQRKIFFGGINVFLQQKLALFRHTPWMLDSLLDSPALIKFATRGGPSVEAEKLGDLTVSMLAGEHGNQRKELHKLVHWLRDEARPQIVHLSNSMLLGMAKPIQQLGIKMVCTLSGEDLFIEKLVPPFYDEARRLLREQATYVDAFVAMNHYYADFMSQYLNVPRCKIAVIPHGLKLVGHGTRHSLPTTETRTIGYLARICPEKGLHLLIAAFEKLMQDPRLPPLKLRVAGYLGELDKPYFAKLQARILTWPEPTRFEFLGEVDRANKIALLQSFDIFSLPTIYHESKGISVLEAMANAVPVVVPSHGTFPELISDTGGGLLHEPENVAALADSLRELLLNEHRATALGLAGQQAIHDRYHSARMADLTIRLYESLIRQAEG